MPEPRRLILSEVGDVTLVRFVDHKILDATAIEELGDELVGLVDHANRKRLLLNFENVTFLSSAALNKLIVLDRRVRAVKGRMKLCCLRPEIREVFEITKLTQIFTIEDNEAAALAAF